MGPFQDPNEGLVEEGFTPRDGGDSIAKVGRILEQIQDRFPIDFINGEGAGMGVTMGAIQIAFPEGMQLQDPPMAGCHHS